MESLSPIDILIALVILGTVVAVLHAIATDIKHTQMRLELARKAIARRERYLREIRGDFDEVEVEVIEEDIPDLDPSKIAA